MQGTAMQQTLPQATKNPGTSCRVTGPLKSVACGMRLDASSGPATQRGKVKPKHEGGDKLAHTSHSVPPRNEMQESWNGSKIFSTSDFPCSARYFFFGTAGFGTTGGSGLIVGGPFGGVSDFSGGTPESTSMYPAHKKGCSAFGGSPVETF